MKKIYPFSIKPVCLLLVGILTLPDCRPLLALMPVAQQSNPALSGASNSFADLSRLQIPAEIGKIEEVFQAKGQESATSKDGSSPLILRRVRPRILADAVKFGGTRDKRQETRNKGQTNLHAPRPSSPAPFVILIQDAHAIPDAQRNIQKLIRFFQKDVGVSLVALEGASSSLDAQIFRSFPDKEILEKTFENYLDRGELTGAVAASIFQDKNLREGDTVFSGIEDWKLYEEGLGLYLSAMEKEEELMDKLEAAKRRLQEEKKKTYSKELLEVDKALEAFKRNDVDLMTVLKQLNRGQFTEKGSGNISLPVPFSVQTLLEEIEKEGKDQSAIEREVRGIAEKVKKYLLQAPSRKPQGYEDPAAWSLKLTVFNQKYQEFQTSLSVKIQKWTVLKGFKTEKWTPP